MFAVQVSHKMIVSNLFQLERDVDFPPVAFGDLVDVADSDVILLEPELDGVADDFNFCANASLVMAADFMASRIKFGPSLRVDIRLISLDRRKISTFLAGVIPDSFAVRF